MTWSEINSADGPMRLFEATPEGPAKGAVVVVQEAFGVNGHIQDVAGRFAGAGWHAVAPEFFHRAGGGSVDYSDFGSVMKKYEGLTGDGARADLDASLGFLHERGYADSSIGVVGFCWGGWVAFFAAVRRSLGAAVTFYGGGIVSPGHFSGFPPLLDEAATLKTPWLGLFGDQDQGISVEDVERLRTALESAGPDHKIIRYADADHGFHCDERPSYNEKSAKDAWTQTLAWLDSHIKSS
jgi:carboxymethylenebutenolidase